MKKSYEDILYCKRPVSKNHPPMSRESRAAQFGSFAALSGYEEAVNEAGRLTDQKIELDENAKEKLDWQIHILQTQMAKIRKWRLCILYRIQGRREAGMKG